MTKFEFSEKLRKALSGRVSHVVVNENVAYYERYIDTEIKKGRSEKEVLEELGDPRLIAKTIIDTAGEEAKEAAGKLMGISRYIAEQGDAEEAEELPDELMELFSHAEGKLEGPAVCQPAERWRRLCAAQRRAEL